MATVPTRVRSSSTDAVPMVAFSSFVRDQRYNGGHSTAPPQQPRPRPFSSFGWEQRYACRDGPPVNGLANSIAQGQTQRDVEMNCHGRPVSKVSGSPETTASLARGGPPLQAHHQRRLQSPSGTLSPPTVVISDSAFGVASVRQYGDADFLPVRGTAAVGADDSDTCCSSTCG